MATREQLMPNRPRARSQEQGPYQPRLIPGDFGGLAVRQSNALGTSIQEMSLLERRVILLVLAVLQRADIELPYVRIYASDIRRVFGLSRNSISEELDAVSDQLVGRSAKFIFDKHGSNLKIPWVFRVFFIAGPRSETGQAYLEIKLHPDIEEHTLQLKRDFFQVPLWVLARCSTEYSIQMCNLLMADSHNGTRPFTVDLPILHEILNCHEKSYTKNFSDFRRRILLPTQKELSEIGYLSFEFEPIKRGHKVIALKFTVDVNANAAGDEGAAEAEADVKRVAIDNAIRNFGYSGNLTKYFNALGVDLVQQVYDEARREVTASLGTKSEIRNPGAFLRSKLNVALENPQAQIITIDQEGKTQLSSSELRSMATELVEEFTVARTEFAYSTFEGLDEEARERIRELAWHQNEFTLARLRAAGEGSMAFRLVIKDILESEGLEYPPDLATVAAYCVPDDFTRYGADGIKRVMQWAEELLS